MDDKKYFLEYKKSFNMLFAFNCEDCAFIKDSNFKYQAVTTKMLKFTGVESVDKLIGKTLADVSDLFACQNDTLIDKLIAQDEKIKNKKKRGTYLELLSYNGENKICVHYKTPIINPDTGNCVGIRGQITNLVLPHIVKTLFKMHGTRGLLIGQDRSNQNSLSEYPINSVQHMVLFLAINNYSYSEISLLLSEFGYQISPIRVNDYLEQLKLIFHVRNKTQLIEKAVGLNFHTFLPDGLFNKFSSMEVSNEEATIIGGNDLIH